MSLDLKVVIPEMGITKTVRFAPEMMVYEAINEIVDKTNDKVAREDHGIFQPMSGSKGRWLDNNRALQGYDLESEVIVVPS
jgi:hypothetical protein